MDGQSIITQVSREEEPLNSTIIVEKVPKKPRTPNLIRQLFCCFRPPNGTVVQQRAPCQSPIVVPIPQTCTVEEIVNSKLEDNCLLEPLRVPDRHKHCVVIDLDETLVHSSFAPVHNADFIIPVDIDGTVHQVSPMNPHQPTCLVRIHTNLVELYKNFHSTPNCLLEDSDDSYLAKFSIGPKLNVYVLKRPYVDEFLQKMGELFECVLFTASLGKYADPVTDLLDKWGVFKSRLFRESCVFHRGSYVKDLSRLGRELNKVVIIDNSPASYMFHPRNAVPIISWFDDPADRELLHLIPFFERLAQIDDIYTLLDAANFQNGFGNFSEFLANGAIVDSESDSTSASS